MFIRVFFFFVPLCQSQLKEAGGSKDISSDSHSHYMRFCKQRSGSRILPYHKPRHWSLVGPGNKGYFCPLVGTHPILADI